MTQYRPLLTLCMVAVLFGCTLKDSHEYFYTDGKPHCGITEFSSPDSPSVFYLVEKQKISIQLPAVFGARISECKANEYAQLMQRTTNPPQADNLIEIIGLEGEFKKDALTRKGFSKHFKVDHDLYYERRALKNGIIVHHYGKIEDGMKLDYAAAMVQSKTGCLFIVHYKEVKEFGTTPFPRMMHYVLEHLDRNATPESVRRQLEQTQIGTE